jgi:hypothetical protein
MTDSERYREQARRALRLAIATPTEDLAGALRGTAADYLERAIELEQLGGQDQRQQHVQPAPQPDAEQPRRQRQQQQIRPKKTEH